MRWCILKTPVRGTLLQRAALEAGRPAKLASFKLAHHRLSARLRREALASCYERTVRSARAEFPQGAEGSLETLFARAALARICRRFETSLSHVSSMMSKICMISASTGIEIN